MLLTATRQSQNAFGCNLRRLMARQEMNANDVAEATGVDLRTIRSMIRGDRTPRATTLKKLADGMGVDPAEFFYDVNELAAAFDWNTQAILRAYVVDHPELFHNWSQANMDELASRFAAGGYLTHEGVESAKAWMEGKWAELARIEVVLESAEGWKLRRYLDRLYELAIFPAGNCPTCGSE
jgi:transcriptional regulator with XRE-family HTH domain